MSATCLARWLLPAAWVSFALGIATVMFETTVGLPSPMAWTGYALAIAGAVLVPVGQVVRAPRAPEFLQQLGDHFERDELRRRSPED